MYCYFSQGISSFQALRLNFLCISSLSIHGACSSPLSLLDLIAVGLWLNCTLSLIKFIVCSRIVSEVLTLLDKPRKETTILECCPKSKNYLTFILNLLHGLINVMTVATMSRTPTLRDQSNVRIAGLNPGGVIDVYITFLLVGGEEALRYADPHPRSSTKCR